MRRRWYFLIPHQAGLIKPDKLGSIKPVLCPNCGPDYDAEGYLTTGRDAISIRCDESRSRRVPTLSAS